MNYLTKPQRQSLHRKWTQNNQQMSYRQFRRTVCREICGSAAMVYWSGMWLGIETDGYTHS